MTKGWKWNQIYLFKKISTTSLKYMFSSTCSWFTKYYTESLKCLLKIVGIDRFLFK